MTADLHPRYRDIWERPDPDEPGDNPREWVCPDRHDFTDRRWLTPEHRAALDAGALDVPDRCQSVHVAVLVSVPHNVTGQPVSWIDRGMAELIYLAHRAGLRIVESCEDGWGGPTVWFDRRQDADDFLRAVGTPVGLARWWPRRSASVLIPAGDMTRVLDALRGSAQ